MKNTRLLFVIWMLFLVLPQGYSQEKKEDSSVLGQVNGFLSKHVKLTAYGQFGYSYTDRKDLDVAADLLTVLHKVMQFLLQTI